MALKPMGKPEVIAPVKSKAKPEIISPAPAPAPSAISTKAAEEAVQSKFGLTAALIEAYPELQRIYELWTSKDYAQAEIEYYKTDYYKNVSDTTSSRVLEKSAKPGIYQQKLEDYKIKQRKRLSQEGIREIDDAFLEEAFLGGWSDNVLDIKAVAKVPTGKQLGGDALQTADSLKTYANSFGMKYNPSQYDKWTRDVFTGMMTIDDLKSQVRIDAASSYPVYAEQISKGVSLDSLSSAYKNSIANILEVDADSVTWDNPYLRKALQSIGPDGKPYVKPLWQFEKELRNTTEWQYTNNARDTMDTLSLKVLKDWGLA
jgi:hypothetical protein